MDIDLLFQIIIKNLLSQLYILEHEFQEVNILINEFKKYDLFKVLVLEPTSTQTNHRFG
jgi:hypothetical protein